MNNYFDAGEISEETLAVGNKKCIICGKSFRAKTTAITCSPKCSKERKKRYDAKYITKHKEQNADYTRKYKHNHKDKTNEIANNAYYRNKAQALARVNTNHHNKKIGVCSDCKEKGKTEFHHLSYEPNIFIELCKKCHNKRHGRDYYGK